MRFQTVIDASRIAAGGLKDLATGLVNPTLRLGVTGLSKSGKTVFITALVHALTKGTRLPVFEAHARAVSRGAISEPQPDDDLPDFYEDHSLVSPLIPDLAGSTRRTQQLRRRWNMNRAASSPGIFSSGKLHIDIVDYPANGSWTCADET